MKFKYILATAIAGCCISGVASAAYGRGLQIQPTSGSITLKNCAASVQGRARITPNAQNPNPSWTQWKPLSTLTGPNGWSFNNQKQECIWRPNSNTPRNTRFDLEWRDPRNNSTAKLYRLIYNP